MCDMNTECDYSGDLITAESPKGVEFECSRMDGVAVYPGRIKVSVCPECEEPDWRTLH